MSIENYGFCPEKINDGGDMPEGVLARVTAVFRDRFEIICGQGTGFARLKSGAYRGTEESVPTVGDFVLADWRKDGDSRILRTCGRASCFTRLSPSSSGRGGQAVAANFDYVWILQPLDRDFNPHRLERYLTLGWQSGGTPVVLLTKADRAEDPQRQLRAAIGTAGCAEVIALSAITGYGLPRLWEYLKPGKTAVLLGPSGAGKSTLVNALAGEERLAVGDVRQKDGRGRHTTSRRQLILLKNGAMVIDTPGMRELGMWEAEDGLGQSFSDVEKYLGRCRFSDCSHNGEPGCAVAKALLEGELNRERWESYRKLCEEDRYARDKAGYLQDKRRRFKEIAKLQRAKGAPDYRREPCAESFTCGECGAPAAPGEAGTRHRNHCPRCLCSLHLDNSPGDRASGCKGGMDPIAVWVRKDGEWALIHRCRVCGALRSNRIAADDNTELLAALAMRGPAALLPRAGGAGGPPAGFPRGEGAVCPVCKTPIPAGGGDHCPQCLCGVHREDPSCGGITEPVSVWVKGDGGLELITRCRGCGALCLTPVRPEDNGVLLLSVAMKPLASPPFPLWQLRETRRLFEGARRDDVIKD